MSDVWVNDSIGVSFVDDNRAVMRVTDDLTFQESSHSFTKEEAALLMAALMGWLG